MQVSDSLSEFYNGWADLGFIASLLLLREAEIRRLIFDFLTILEIDHELLILLLIFLVCLLIRLLMIELNFVFENLLIFFENLMTFFENLKTFFENSKIFFFHNSFQIYLKKFV